jgi:hypothetical protein
VPIEIKRSSPAPTGLSLEEARYAIMSEIPAAAELTEHLVTIVGGAQQQARGESVRLKSEFAAHGAARSTRLIIAVSGRVDAIHRQTLAEAMSVVLDFAKRMQFDIRQTVALVRPHLEDLGNLLLAEIPAAGSGAEQLRFRAQYGEVFDLRLDRALRDLAAALSPPAG